MTERRRAGWELIIEWRFRKWAIYDFWKRRFVELGLDPEELLSRPDET